MSRRPLLAVLVTVMVAVLALLSTAGTASAHTTSAPATPSNQNLSSHPPSDGCSTPGANIDRIPGVFDFGHACIHHDSCYRGLNRAGDPARISRLSCDNTFLADMRASCAEMHPNSTTTAARQCRDSATLYYLAVRFFGRSGYTGTGSRF